MVRLQPLIAQCAILGHDVMGVRAEDQRNAILSVHGEDESVDLLLLIGVMILNLQHHRGTEVGMQTLNQFFCIGESIFEHAGDTGCSDEHILRIEGQQ